MMHLLAFGESVDPAGAYVQIDAVQDQVVTTNGKYAYIPNGAANLIGIAACVDNTVGPLAYFSSPSIRSLANMQVRPVNDGLVFGDPLRFALFGNSPFPLVVNEGLEFDVNDNPASAVEHYGLAWLADGAVKPTFGNLFTVHATGAATLAANSWVNTNLTFDDTLPAGTYQVLGLRVEGANLVAARLVFVGGTFRPGVPGSVDETVFGDDPFRFGNLGVYGQFDNTTPPTLDCLGVTDTSQDVWMDLVKVK